MVLMRVFSKMDKEGNISIPNNICKAIGLREDQLVELKIVGTGAKSILVTPRKSAR